MPTPKDNKAAAPYAVLGAGDMVSHLQRRGDECNSLEYRFNLFRFRENSEATHAFRPADLRDIVKLCQVLASTLADDGWIHDELIGLANELDELTQKWSSENHGT